jgi:hypothetical protein
MLIDRLRSIVLSYDEDTQQLNVQLVERAKLAPLLVGSFKAPIPLDDFGLRLDDEFARRLGVTMLNLVSLGQPAIKLYMTATQHPID